MENEKLPEHIQKMLSVIPQLSNDVGIAIPETTEKLTQIHQELAAGDIQAAQDNVSWLVLIANRLIVENMALRQRADYLTTELINKTLHFCGVKQSFRF